MRNCFGLISILCLSLGSSLQAATVRGAVHDSETGAPVSGTVTVTVAGGMTPQLRTDYEPLPGSAGIQKASARTDPTTGRFEIPSLMPGRRLLYVSAPAYGFEYVPVEIHEGTTEVPSIGLSRAGGATGTVVNEHGRPIAGAQVYAYYSNPRIIAFLEQTWIGDQIPTVETDGNGRFAIDLALKPNTRLRLLARSGRYLPVVSEEMMVKPGETLRGIRLQLQQEGIRVLIRVQDPRGQPVPDGSVLFSTLGREPRDLQTVPGYARERGRSGTTNANGIAEFLSVSAGRRLLAVRANGYRLHREWVEIDGTRELVEITVVLETR